VRTRQRVLSEALRLFGERGFYGTQVDEIADAAETSRATLYQYFGSKEEIFTELLETCGAELMRLAHRLGPLGPTPQGFETLHWWIGAWAWVYDRYVTMFVEAAKVEASDADVRAMVVRFIRSYTARVAERLGASGMEGPEADTAALLLTSLVHHFNYLRCQALVPLPGAEYAIDGLAVCMQLMLFPQTPAAVFGEVHTVPTMSRQPVVELDAQVEVVAVGSTLGPRASETVGRILTAAARLFAERGYNGTGIDDLAAAAGVGRATFYRYFGDKPALLRTLAREYSVAAVELVERLATVEPASGPNDELREWLSDFVVFSRRYIGVFRTIAQGVVADEEQLKRHRNGMAVAHQVARSLLGRVQRRYPLDVDVAAAVFVAMLDRLPEALMEIEPDVSDERIASVMQDVVQRALFNTG
jgi:AcrR family transcriptional regulator